MADGMLGQLRARGEELFGRVSAELMQNPRFMKALEAAFKGKARLDEAVAGALKRMNIPTRTEFKRALRRIEDLERQVAELRARPAAPAPRQRAARPAATRRAARSSRKASGPEPAE